MAIGCVYIFLRPFYLKVMCYWRVLSAAVKSVEGLIIFDAVFRLRLLLFISSVSFFLTQKLSLCSFLSESLPLEPCALLEQLKGVSGVCRARGCALLDLTPRGQEAALTPSLGWLVSGSSRAPLLCLEGRTVAMWDRLMVPCLCLLLEPALLSSLYGASPIAKRSRMSRRPLWCLNTQGKFPPPLWKPGRICCLEPSPQLSQSHMEQGDRVCGQTGVSVNVPTRVLQPSGMAPTLLGEQDGAHA